MKMIHMITFSLLVVGGLNWLLTAFEYNVVEMYLPMTAAQAIYILIGLSAIYEIATHKGNCKMCAGETPKM